MTLARELAALLTDQAVGLQPDPVVSATTLPLPRFGVPRSEPAETLDDHRAQTEEQRQETGVEPCEIHRGTSASSFGSGRPRCYRTRQFFVLGNMHAIAPA